MMSHSVQHQVGSSQECQGPDQDLVADLLNLMRSLKNILKRKQLKRLDDLQQDLEVEAETDLQGNDQVLEEIPTKSESLSAQIGNPQAPDHQSLNLPDQVWHQETDFHQE